MTTPMIPFNKKVSKLNYMDIAATTIAISLSISLIWMYIRLEQLIP